MVCFHLLKWKVQIPNGKSKFQIPSCFDLFEGAMLRSLNHPREFLRDQSELVSKGFKLNYAWAQLLTNTGQLQSPRCKGGFFSKADLLGKVTPRLLLTVPGLPA